MSNTLAIAGVSAVLKDLLDSGLSELDIPAMVGSSVLVSLLAPDAIGIGDEETVPRLNLFLHQVTPNAGWRNVDLPSRDASARRIGNPPLALDLHYLLTAYGVAELQAEVLLGYGMQVLHEHPVIPRGAIRASLEGTPVSATFLPPLYQALRSADLAGQVELLKITPSVMDSEAMSRLWSALTAHYRPTAPFQVSVVLIERQVPAIAPLPVLTRGRYVPGLQRDQGVLVTPAMLPPYPALESALAAAHSTPSMLQNGDLVHVRGHHLAGRARFIVLRNDAFQAVHEIAVPDGLDEDDLAFTAALPASLPVGIYGLELRVLRADQAQPRTSNPLPVALAPSIDFSSIEMEHAVPPDARERVPVLIVRLRCHPRVRAGQRAALLMDTLEAPARRFTGDSDTLVFHFHTAPPAGARPLLRLRVDGIESIAVNRGARPPAFFDHRVTLP